MKKKPYVIERAVKEDREAILDVMRPWNMHHVPSPEMEELDLNNFFVARCQNRVVGAAGYKILSEDTGKTTLLAVLPEFKGLGIGSKLHHTRCEAMHRLGVKRVITNSDLPETIAWYRRQFGYRPIGRLKKVCSFGDPEIDHWTTMEMDLESYMRGIEPGR